MEEKPPANETKQQARKHLRSARAIGESEEWLFMALQSIGDAVIATDAQGHVVFMNLVAVNLTGWSEEEAQGTDCREVFRIVNEATRLETESPVAKVLRDGVISGLANHTILISRGGAEHYIDDSGSPIRDKAGELIGVVLIFRDITERRKSERTRQEQQEILQTLFDHIPVIVTFLDEKQQFKWVNREWTHVMGWTIEELHAEDHAGMLRPSAAVESETESQSWKDVKLTVKDGRALDFSWATVRLSNGTTIMIGQDVTERKRLEAMSGEESTRIQERNRRLEQAMRETEHRVKNNLQSVAALLDMQVLAHDTVVPVRELTQIRMHMKTIASIHDMLVADLKDEGARNVMSAKAALDSLLPMVQQIVGPQRIQWRIDDLYLPIKHGISVAVLINELVSNAVKHGGQKVELSLMKADDDGVLEVWDDGPGFDEEFHPDTSAHYGLELVESIGRTDLGGKVTYQNGHDGGACVRVIFPLPELPVALAS